MHSALHPLPLASDHRGQRGQSHAARLLCGPHGLRPPHASHPLLRRPGEAAASLNGASAAFLPVAQAAVWARRHQRRLHLALMLRRWTPRCSGRQSRPSLTPPKRQPAPGCAWLCAHMCPVQAPPMPPRSPVLLLSPPDCRSRPALSFATFYQYTRMQNRQLQAGEKGQKDELWLIYDCRPGPNVCRFSLPVINATVNIDTNLPGMHDEACPNF